MTIELFTRVGCHLCETVHEVLQRVRRDVPFDLVTTDIDRVPALVVKYGWDVPVVTIDGEFFSKHRIDEQALRTRLGSGARA